MIARGSKRRPDRSAAAVDPAGGVHPSCAIPHPRAFGSRRDASSSPGQPGGSRRAHRHGDVRPALPKTATRSPNPVPRPAPVGDWWPTFANVPDILEHAVQGFGLYQSPKRVLDPRAARARPGPAGWAAGSQFVFSQHCKSLRAHRRARRQDRGGRATGTPRRASTSSSVWSSHSPTAWCSIAAASPTSSSRRCTTNSAIRRCSSSPTSRRSTCSTP